MEQVLVNGATLGVEMYVDAPNLLAIVESWQPGVAGETGSLLFPDDFD
jgi:hypothetical protein